MNKKEMCESLINSSAWDGTDDVEVLMRYSLAEIEDNYNMIENMEIECEFNNY